MVQTIESRNLTICSDERDTGSDKPDIQTPLDGTSGGSVLINTVWYNNVGLEAPYNYESLHQAVAASDFMMVEHLLRQRIDVNILNKEHRTALHVAVDMASMDMTSLLLSYHAQVNALDRKGRSVLHTAAALGSTQLVSLLVDNGSNIEAACLKKKRPIHMAAKRGHFQVVWLLLEHGAAIDAEDELQRTPTFLAAAQGHTQLVSHLLQRGANIYTEDTKRRKLPHIAAKFGYTDLIQVLHDSGVDMDAHNATGKRPLHMAAKEGHLKVISLLLDLDHKIEVQDYFRQTPLHLAAAKGQKDAAALLLSKGADIDALDMQLYTPLHTAALHGQLDVVALLISNGANIHKRTRYDWPVLHLAVKGGVRQVTSMILKNGADIRATDKTNWTALHLAASLGYTGIALDLLEFGAAIDQKTVEGKTPLYLAVKKGHLRLMNLLLEYGADMKVTSAKGRTPLFAATKNVRLDLIPILVQKGANVHTTDYESWTVLHRAASLGESEVVKLLLKMGCNINAKNDAGDTPIVIATKENQPGVVSVMVDHGADINTSDRKGSTLLHIAVTNGHVDMVNMLLRAGAVMSCMGNSEKSLLHAAAEIGHASIIEIALTHECTSTPIGDDDKIKSLHCAAELGRVEAVKSFLKTSINVNVTDGTGETALHKACKCGQTQMALTLIENGAHVEAQEYENDHTPLFVAAAHPDVISVLIANEANLEAVCKTGSTVLHHYSANGHVNGLLLLLNYGCDIESKNKEGWTALHFATKNRRLEVMKVLLQYDIEPDISNAVGETALRMAVDLDNVEMAEILLENGADINARMGEHMETVLHHAVSKTSMNMVSWLLYRGADIHAEDKAGMTALHMAAVESRAAMIKLLLSNGAEVNVTNRTGYSPLVYAILHDNLEIGKILVDAGTDMNNLPNVVNKFMVNYLKKYAERRQKIRSTSLIAQPKQPPLSQNQFFMNVSRVDELWVDYCVNSFDSSQHNVNNVPSRLSVSILEHKYMRGFPKWKRLDQGSLPAEEDFNTPNKKNLRRDKLKSESVSFRGQSFQAFSPVEQSSNNQGESITCLLKAPYPDFSIEKWAIQVIGSLFEWAGCKLYVSHSLFYLKLYGQQQGLSPQWAFQFDRIKGVIREPGILLVEALQMTTKLSVPGWYENENHVLRFINSIYVCRMASKAVNSEVFSEVLGSPEDKLSTKVHATLIAGMAIIGIVGGHHNVEKLVKAILDAGPSKGMPLPCSKQDNWQVRDRIKCPCSTGFTHGPLSPVAAVKAIGLDILGRRKEHIVPRVWDLQDDKLVEGWDVRCVVFITHTWLRSEVQYSDVSQPDVVSPNGISTKSKKLKSIRDALLAYTRYVWVDTICLNQANLSELDQSLRSMHNWYSNCSAVVLDSITRLRKWRTRGWCFQEGNSSGSLYAIADKQLVSIQQLAKEQHLHLCKLDLSIYYQPGNAVKVLARMDRRKTTRPEDMSYSMIGIFNVSINLKYGEGDSARKRLLEALATQRGDLSFLSFPTMVNDLGRYLPETRHQYYLVAKCTVASAQVSISHTGMMIPVALVKLDDADQVTSALASLKILKKLSKGRYMGIATFLNEVQAARAIHSKTIAIAIIRDIKSVMLIEKEGQDLLTPSGGFLKWFHRLHCCQVESLEFDRIFKDIKADRECIWLGDNSRTSSFQSVR